MQLSTQIFVVILATLVATSSGTEIQNPDILEAPWYVACGGALNASTTVISYKPDTSLSPNERCVWTVRSPDAVTYSLEVLSFGLNPQPGELGMTASCITRDSITLSHVNIVEAGTVTLSTACPILIITYYSGGNVLNSRGFVMLYTSTTGRSDISASSMQYVIIGEEGYVRYPSTTCTAYTDYEVSSFVFAPPENIHNPERKSLVTYSLNGLEGTTCRDSIRGFKFSPITGWTHNQSIPGDYICGDTQFKSWAIDDMLMLIFRSDISQGFYGFHLTYSTLPVNFA
ncbi:unnamed protein product [Orchesella dallaii]|uniref:CUB domain-containing protein n=1 Tax=Orchesella dallaii TaxID=48710 RepID=A0ABP1RL94_9HEXA